MTYLAGCVGFLRGIREAHLSVTNWLSPIGAAAIRGVDATELVALQRELAVKIRHTP